MRVKGLLNKLTTGGLKIKRVSCHTHRQTAYVGGKLGQHYCLIGVDGAAKPRPVINPGNKARTCLAVIPGLTRSS